MSKPKDLYFKDDYGVGASSEAANPDPSGISAFEFVKATDQLWSVTAQSVLSEMGLHRAFVAPMDAHRVLDLGGQGPFAAQGIAVTEARASIGALIERSQRALQVIRNERTGSAALVMSAEVFEQIVERGTGRMARELGGYAEDMKRDPEERRATRSRQRLLSMLDTMETIKADIPIIEGGASAPDVVV